MPDRSFLEWPFFEAAHRELAQELEQFARQYLSSLDEEGADDRKLCTALVAELGRSGFLKHTVPAPFGGKSERLDVRSLCLCRESLARYSSLADFSFAMQGLGSGPLSLFGSKDLKDRFLPDVATGKKIAAFALSEEEAGSDVAALRTSAELQGDRYVLNGSKTWISNAGIADFYTVIARTGEASGAKGLSTFVVEGDCPGLSIDSSIRLSSPHPLGTLHFENCKIPRTHLIGASGQGFKVAMATLDVFRSTVGAAALGFARRALDEALRHVTQRKLFGQNLAQFQMTQDKIAQMAVEIDASALLIYRAAWTKDSGAERVTREAAMAKYYATEAAQRVIDQAVQLLGGHGVRVGSSVEKLYRDIRPLRIYEGTSEIQKIIIAQQVLSTCEERAK